MSLLNAKKIFIFCMLLLLTGCAINEHYVPPSQGPTATIAFSQPANVEFNTMTIYKDPYKCTRPQTIGAVHTWVGDKNVPPFKIKATGLFTFTMLNADDYGLSYSHCDKTISFYPKPNEYYFVHTSVDKAAQTCHFGLYKMIGNNKPIPVKKIFVRKTEMKLFTHQKVCVDKMAGNN